MREGPLSFRTSSLDETRALVDEFYYPLDINVRGSADRFAFGLDVIQLGYRPSGPVSQPYISDDCRLLALKIDRAALEGQLASLLGHPINEPLRLPLGNDLTTGAGRSLARLLALMQAELDDQEGLIYQPLIAGRLWQGVLTGLLLATAHQYRDDLERRVQPSRPRTVKRAIDAMEAEPERPFTVNSLAAIAGTSVRTLQEGFRQHVGVAPMAYLRRLRLARAHADLCTADPRQETVANVAHRWGFAHLGRFAAAYRTEYGQSPADTLRSP